MEQVQTIMAALKLNDRKEAPMQCDLLYIVQQVGGNSGEHYPIIGFYNKKSLTIYSGLCSYVLIRVYLYKGNAEVHVLVFYRTYRLSVFSYFLCIWSLEIWRSLRFSRR